MKYLIYSLVFFIINIILIIMGGVSTGNWTLFIILFSFITIFSSGITWFIHFQYRMNDRKYRLYFQKEDILVEDKDRHKTFLISSDVVRRANYFKRKEFGHEGGFLEPSFFKYYYLELQMYSGESILISCLAADPFIFNLENSYFRDNLQFIEKNIPFISERL